MSIFSCRDAAGLVAQSMDRKLSFREGAGLHMHLLMCRLCSRFSRQMHTLKQLTSRLRRARSADEVGAMSFSAAAKDRIQRALKADGGLRE